jgi:hypothetical protein
MVQISGALKTILSHDWTWIYERGIDLFNVKWVFMADDIPNSLRCFCSLCHESLSLYQKFSSGFGDLWKHQKFLPISTLNNFSQKTDLGTWILCSEMAPVHCQSCCFRLKGEGPQSYAFTMWPIRKAFVMTSYRAHHLWNFESVKEFLPSLLLWQFRQQSRKNLETTVTVMWGRHLS